MHEASPLFLSSKRKLEKRPTESWAEYCFLSCSYRKKIGQSEQAGEQFA